MNYYPFISLAIINYMPITANYCQQMEVIQTSGYNEYVNIYN